MSDLPSQENISMIWCARRHTLQRGGEFLIRTILMECRPREEPLLIYARRKNVFVRLFPVMPLIMEMNQPLINADFDFKRFRNKAQLNNSPTDGYKYECAFCNIWLIAADVHTRHCAQPGLMPIGDISPRCLYSMTQTLQFIIPAQSIPISNSSTSYLISHICWIYYTQPRYVLTLSLQQPITIYASASREYSAVCNKGTFQVDWNSNCI